MIEKDVCRNPIHPGPMIRSPPQTSKCGQRPQKGLLEQILRVGGVAGQATQVPEHLGLVHVNDVTEGQTRLGHRSFKHRPTRNVKFQAPGIPVCYADRQP